MLLKSILGRPAGRKSTGVGASWFQFCWKNHGKDEGPSVVHESGFHEQQLVWKRSHVPGLLGEQRWCVYVTGLVCLPHF